MVAVQLAPACASELTEQAELLFVPPCALQLALPKRLPASVAEQLSFPLPLALSPSPPPTEQNEWLPASPLDELFIAEQKAVSVDLAPAPLGTSAEQLSAIEFWQSTEQY